MPERENELFCYFSSSLCSFLRTNPLFEPPKVKLLFCFPQRVSFFFLSPREERKKFQSQIKPLQLKPRLLLLAERAARERERE